MRVLLTGAGGFVGHHMLEHLLVNTDWEIVITDSWQHKGKHDRVREVIEGHKDWQCRVQSITHDLTAPFTAPTMLRIGHIDYVIAMASQSHVERSIDDPVPFVQNNVNVALNVLEYCRLAQPSKVILVSTDEVYGPMLDQPHPEWSPILPSNPYSASKACQEAIAISYWRTYGVPVIITNTMNIIGERQDPEKFLPMLIRDISNGQEVTIHGTKEEVGSRFYLHARNAADAWLFILQNVEPAVWPQFHTPHRLNVVGEQQISNLQLAVKVAGIIDTDLYYKLVDFHSARPGHDAHYGLDGFALEFLGWKPPITFDESLRRAVEWSLSHPEWLE